MPERKTEFGASLRLKAGIFAIQREKYSHKSQLQKSFCVIPAKAGIHSF